MGRQKKRTGEDEVLSDTEEPIPTAKDVQVHVGGYDPNVDIEPNLAFDKYVKKLFFKLARDARLPPACPFSEMVELVEKVRECNPSWERLIAIRARGETVGSQGLRKRIRKRGLTLNEWAMFWSGLGGWMRWKEAKEARRRQGFELSDKTKRAPAQEEQAQEQEEEVVEEEEGAEEEEVVMEEREGAEEEAEKMEVDEPEEDSGAGEDEDKDEDQAKDKEAPAAFQEKSYLADARALLVGKGKRETAVDRPTDETVKEWGQIGQSTVT